MAKKPKNQPESTVEDAVSEKVIRISATRIAEDIKLLSKEKADDLIFVLLEDYLIATNALKSIARSKPKTYGDLLQLKKFARDKLKGLGEIR